MIAPHTLSNFQSLTKLIPLIINHFYSHCRSDWQIVLTKQNFSYSLCKGIISFLYFVAKLRIKSKTTKNNAPPPRWRKLAACAQFKIYNSLFRPHSHPSHYSHCSHNRSPQIAQLQHFPPFERGVGGNVTLFPSPSHNSKFRIHNS